MATIELAPSARPAGYLSIFDGDDLTIRTCATSTVIVHATNWVLGSAASGDSLATIIVYAGDRIEVHPDRIVVTRASV